MEGYRMTTPVSFHFFGSGSVTEASGCTRGTFMRRKFEHHENPRSQRVAPAGCSYRHDGR